MDGELSVVGGHSLQREAARGNLGSPVASTKYSRSYLPEMISPIYQLVYEWHLFARMVRGAKLGSSAIERK